MKSLFFSFFFFFLSCYHSGFVDYKPATVLSIRNKTGESFYIKIQNELNVDTFFIPNQSNRIKIHLKSGINILTSNYYKKEFFVRSGVEYRKTFD